MTLNELFKKITTVDSNGNRVIQDHLKDLTVVIELDEAWIGPTACTGIETVHAGFDWNHGKFLLFPSDRIIRKYKSKQV